MMPVPVAAAKRQAPTETLWFQDAGTQAPPAARAVAEAADAAETLAAELTRAIETYIAGLTEVRTARRVKTFNDYREAFDRLAADAGRLGETLRRVYDDLTRLYRTSPTAPEYKTARAAYERAKAVYEAAVERLATAPRPDTLTHPEIRVVDGRLRRRLEREREDGEQEKIATPAAAATGQLPEPEADIAYLGVFDGVEVYVVAGPSGKAHYLLTNFRRRVEDGDVIESAVLASDMFPVNEADDGGVDRHLERLLTVRFRLLQLSPDDRDALHERLRIARTYGKAQ